MLLNCNLSVSPYQLSIIHGGRYSPPPFFKLNWQKSPILSFLSVFSPSPPKSRPLEWSFWADTIYKENLASHHRMFLSVSFTFRPTEHHHYCSYTSEGESRLAMTAPSSSLQSMANDPMVCWTLDENSCPSTDICNILCHFILSKLRTSESRMFHIKSCSSDLPVSL